MFIKKYRSPGAVAGRSKWQRWAGLCRGLCGRDARAPRKPSSTQKTGNMVYIMPGNAGESGKTPYASLEYHSPLEGESARRYSVRQSSRWGQTPRPVSEYSRHGQWRAYDKKCDDGLRQKQSTTRRFWSNRAFRNCRSVLETVCEVLSGPHRSLTPRLPPPPQFGGSASTPHRISLRLPARLLRLPLTLKGGVIGRRR